MGWMIFVGVVLALALLIGTIYNRLVALRQNRQNAFADIDVQLTQRADLIPNLVETVKGYASHEQGVFEEVTRYRSNARDAKTEGQRLQAEAGLGKALVDLYAVAENYPDLKADANFRQLMSELGDIENKLAAARRFFNNSTAEYNTAQEQFPAVLFAGFFGFQKEPFYEVTAEERDVLEKAPSVEFSNT